MLRRGRLKVVSPQSGKFRCALVCRAEMLTSSSDYGRYYYLRCGFLRGLEIFPIGTDCDIPSHPRALILRLFGGSDGHMVSLGPWCSGVNRMQLSVVSW